MEINLINNFGLLIFSATLTFLICFPLAKTLRFFQIVDTPNKRSSHAVTMIRGGGIGIFLPVYIVIASCKNQDNHPIIIAILISLAFILIISFLDDLFSLSIKVRIIIQIIGSYILVEGITKTGISPISDNYQIFTCCCVTIFCVGYANVFNFMDGINGLVTAHTIIASCFSLMYFGIITQRWDSEIIIIYSTLAGAALGFLPHNFPRPSMFMGDVGSVAIGFIFAGLITWCAQYISLILLVPLILIHANFLLDTSFTLLSRIAKQSQWWQPHKEHFYQKLLCSNNTHQYVTNLQIKIQIFCSILLLLTILAQNTLKVIIYLFVIILWIQQFYQWQTAFQQRKTQF